MGTGTRTRKPYYL